MKPFFIALAIAASGLRAQGADVESLKHAVVRLTTPTTEGAGVIVGSDEQTIFIATAAHVVPTANVDVYFNAARHKKLSGRLYQVSTEIDLAVVVVDVPPGVIRDALQRVTYRVGAPRATAVWTIGHAGGLWEASADVNKLQGQQLNTLTFSNNGVLQGASGGPLFDSDNRLLGIVSTVEGTKATAVKVQSLVDSLELWKVGANLLVAPSASVSLAVSPVSPPAPGSGGTRIVIVNGLGCGPNLQITAGGKTFQTAAQQNTLEGFPLGTVPYTMTGFVVCAGGTRCNVDSKGEVTVQAGDVLHLRWADHRVHGKCAISLSKVPQRGGGRPLPPG
jgi:hypothetical protein